MEVKDLIVTKRIDDFYNKGDEVSEKELRRYFTENGLRCLKKDGYIEEQITEVEFEISNMEPGRIYYIEYGESTAFLGRYLKSDTCHHYFQSGIHYWNGYETEKTADYCVKTGISQIREASKPEKHRLFQHEVSKNLA